MSDYRLQLIEIPDDPGHRVFGKATGHMLCNLAVPEAEVLPLLRVVVGVLEAAEPVAACAEGGPE